MHQEGVPLQETTRLQNAAARLQRAGRIQDSPLVGDMDRHPEIVRSHIVQDLVREMIGIYGNVVITRRH